MHSGFFFFSQSGFVPRSFPRLAMVALLLLVLLVSCSVAEAPLTEPADIAAKAQRMREGAPKTPEELLLMLKEFMEHEPKDPLRFMERLSGTASEEWATENGGDWRQKFAWYSNVIYGGGGLGKAMRIPTPYMVSFNFSHGAYYRTTFTSKLSEVNVSRFDKAFRLTPQITRNILGAPFLERVHLPDPYHDGLRYGDVFLVYYFYRIGEFEIQLTYPTEGYPPQPIHPDAAYKPAVRSEVGNMQRFLKEFKNHKDFTAKSIWISRLIREK
ncbi:MAG: hypothetical protein ACOY3Z_07560 [Thermodesulfobacteriota bacterium]